ncbi:MAG: fused MFS/spermidine synthase [Pseudomonadota bacterium]
MNSSFNFRVGLLLVAFVEGFLSMGFQLVANRLLAPHFGSSLYVWAFLISTFLLAFSSGAFLGGWISSKIKDNVKPAITVAVVGSVAFLFTALFGRYLLQTLEPEIDSLILGLAIFCPLLFFIPVLSLSCLLPVLTQLNTQHFNAGLSAGLIWGISTIGNVAGVMLTVFFLIPQFATSNLLYLWSLLAIVCFVWFIAVATQSAKTQASNRALTNAQAAH